MFKKLNACISKVRAKLRRDEEGAKQRPAPVRGFGFGADSSDESDDEAGYDSFDSEFDEEVGDMGFEDFMDLVRDMFAAEMGAAGFGHGGGPGRGGGGRGGRGGAPGFGHTQGRGAGGGGYPGGFGGFGGFGGESDTDSDDELPELAREGEGGRKSRRRKPTFDTYDPAVERRKERIAVSAGREGREGREGRDGARAATPRPGACPQEATLLNKRLATWMVQLPRPALKGKTDTSVTVARDKRAALRTAIDYPEGATWALEYRQGAAAEWTLAADALHPHDDQEYTIRGLAPGTKVAVRTQPRFALGEHHEDFAQFVTVPDAPFSGVLEVETSGSAAPAPGPGPAAAGPSGAGEAPGGGKKKRRERKGRGAGAQAPARTPEQAEAELAREAAERVSARGGSAPHARRGPADGPGPRAAPARPRPPPPAPARPPQASADARRERLLAAIGADHEREVAGVARDARRAEDAERGRAAPRSDRLDARPGAGKPAGGRKRRGQGDERVGSVNRTENWRELLHKSEEER